MTRYADPRRCPDCRSAIAPGDAACGTCRLSLRGESAQRLFSTLALADDLLRELRASSAPVPVASGPTTSALPAAPASPAAPRRSRLGAASVPKILLGLGAGCLLVAAVVFLAVAWSALGLGGRTTVLVALTVVAGGLGAWAARRRLRAAAESLSVVSLGLVGLDLVGAERAGWLGDLSLAGFLVLLGVVLMGSACAAAVAAAHTTTLRLTGAEIVSVIGLAVLTGGLVGTEWLPIGPSLVLCTLVPALAGVVAARLVLRLVVAGSVAVTGCAWSALTVYGVGRVAVADADWRTLWLGHDVWPLLVAAALVAGLALVHRLPLAARVGAAAVGHLLLTIAVLAPLQDLGVTGLTVVALGVLAATAVATWCMPRSWSSVNLLTQGVAAAGTLLAVVALTGEALARLGEASVPVWVGSAGDQLPAAPAGDVPAGWLVPLCVLALTGTAWSLLRAGRLAVDLRVPAHGAWGAAVLAGSLVLALALYPVPVWLVVSTLVLTAVAFTAWWLRSERPVLLALAAGHAGAALILALHADWLSAAVLALLTAFGALVHLRARADAPVAVAGGLLAAAVAGSVWTWGAIAAVEESWVALAAVVVLGLLVLVAPFAPDRWWRAAQPVPTRAGLEVGAALAALAASVAGLSLAPLGETASWAAVYLTTLGVEVTIVSLQRADRRSLGWVGGVLLAAASWVRLADLGVHAPEAYTLPSAAALLLVGLLRLRRDPRSSTPTTVAPGISLAVVPSLLWVIVEPTGPRSLLLGLGCLVLVLLGARLGWTAPLVIGSVAGSVLVLRLAAPYVADAVPRWVLIGAAGALLLAVGATWERRLDDARQLATYVRALR